MRCLLLITNFVTFDFKSGIDPVSIAPGPARSYIRKQITTTTIDNIHPNQNTFIRTCVWFNEKKIRFFFLRRYTNGSVQVRDYPRKIEKPDRFTSAIESLLQKVPEDSWRGIYVEQRPSRQKQSREAKQKEESSCLFDGAIKGLFMFISHLKRSHKTSDCAHKPSAGHKSCCETCTFESHLDSDTYTREVIRCIGKRRLRLRSSNIEFHATVVDIL